MQLTENIFHTSAMNLFDHIPDLTYIGYFNAELSGLPIRPYKIPPDTMLIELLTGGTVFFGPDGKKEPMNRGTVFCHVSGDNTIWDTPAESPYKCAVFRFEISGAERLLPRVFRWRGGESALDEFLHFSRSWYGEKPDDPGLAAYCLSVLAGHALAPGSAVCSPVSAGIDVPADSRLCRLLDHLDRNTDAMPDISELCRISGLARNRLFQEFKYYFKCTPHAYLQQRRIRRAEQLLETTALPIKEIADRCGFDNIEVFYRTFKLYTGTTPKAFRNACTSYGFTL